MLTLILWRIGTKKFYWLAFSHFESNLSFLMWPDATGLSRVPIVKESARKPELLSSF